MILLIDNYDSFSYNLYQLIGSIEPNIKVIRNDAMSVKEIADLKPEAIIISPGPGHPEDAGVCVDVVKELGKTIPILGVCLGHQAICTAYGATVSYAKHLMHGKQSLTKLDSGCPLFKGCAEKEPVARYHSLAVIEETMPDSLKAVAWADDGEIMAVMHSEYPVYGVQFHPESIMTPNGRIMLQNFIENARKRGKKSVIKEAIIRIVNKGDLSYDEAYAVMNEIMSGETTPTQNAAFLAALSTKSTKAETIEEISGCAAAMRAHALEVNTGMDTMEIVGTGGDGAHSFNISTTAMFVMAAGGVKVSKHGNRAASSLSGTADCLEALGVNIQQSPEKCVEMLEKAGACFMFAQKYHSSMKYVGAIRKELGFRTVFNILGPITNPAKPAYQLLGVYDEYLVEPLAKVLTSLGVKRGIVVHGQDKLDEISISAPTTVCDFGNGEYKTYTIKPEDFGLARASKGDIVGGTPQENAQITRDILSGVKGPKRDIVLMNAGTALYVAGKADTIADGVKLAAELIDSGKAMQTLEKMIAVSNA